MGVLWFMWWSVRIISEEEIEAAAKEESQEIERLLREGKMRREDAVQRGNASYMQSIPMLFIFIGVVGGFTGSLFANMVSHFLNADVKTVWAPGNAAWTVAGLVCVLLALYVGLWADRRNRFYRAMGVGAAHGARAEIV